ncbi:glycosyltransferase family 9 protein [bacterium]|nr:glycosyltransferase family 9 protein [bacterium]
MENKKILIIKLGAIGDVVHTTIIPEAIKLKHPTWEIHYMTSSVIAPILVDNKYIDKIIKYEKCNCVKLIKTIKELRKEKYDIVINLSYSIKNLILSYSCGAKQCQNRIYTNKSWVEDYFYSAKRVINDIEMPEYLALENNTNLVNSVKNKLDKYPKPYIVLNPGGYSSNIRQGRLWNIEKWKRLTQKLAETYGGTIFINGSKREREYHNNLKSKFCHIISGDFSLKESCALLSLADLVISGDSGPLHIASAQKNVKTLAILGSTSPDKIKPFGKNGYYIGPKSKCKYCWKKKCKYLKEQGLYTPCTESISTEMVVNKIKTNKLLKEYSFT